MKNIYINHISVYLTRGLKWINEFQIRVKSQGLLNKNAKNAGEIIGRVKCRGVR